MDADNISSQREPQPAAWEVRNFGRTTEGHAALVLESSDGTLFKVDKAFLSFLSPVFETMLQDCPADEKPLQLAEDASTLHLLFSVMHQHDLPGYVYGLTIKSAVKAAEKYGMRLARESLERLTM